MAKKKNPENLVFTTDLHNFRMIDNYLYLYHVNQFIILPAHPESINDSTSVNFAQTAPLSRSAPIYSYQNSGPRTVQVSFSLHREMMTQINYTGYNIIEMNGGDDYVDYLIKQIQACTLPSYAVAVKMVNPPIVALRMGEDVYIKGVLSGSLGLSYKPPILRNGKYAVVDLSFTIQEIDPFDAKDVMLTGSYRSSAYGNLNLTLERRGY